MASMEGQAVRILEAGNKYEGRVGRASHFVAGHSASDADPLLVVAVARSHAERRKLTANPYSDHYEYACSWMPFRASHLQLLDGAEAGAEGAADGGAAAMNDDDGGNDFDAARAGADAPLPPGSSLKVVAAAAARDAQAHGSSSSSSSSPSSICMCHSAQSSPSAGR